MDVPDSREAEYVRWNQMTRHQIIVAHMTLIGACDEAAATLAKAMETTTSYGMLQLAEMAAKKITDNNR